MEQDKFIPWGHPEFYKMLEEEARTHAQKNQDYTKGGSPLGNFNRVSDMLRQFGVDLSPAQVGFIYMMKQLDSAGRMLFQDYEGETEGLDQRLLDVSVYAKLIRILKHEEKKQLEERFKIK